MGLLSCVTAVAADTSTPPHNGFDHSPLSSPNAYLINIATTSNIQTLSHHLMKVRSTFLLHNVINVCPCCSDLASDHSTEGSRLILSADKVEFTLYHSVHCSSILGPGLMLCNEGKYDCSLAR